MSDPLFDPEKCDVPEVPKLDFDFVSECSIPEPPPPIFDCMPPLVPRDPPPVPCPSFESSIDLKSAISRDDTSCQVAPLPTGALVVTPTDNDPCRFFIDLNLDIPIPQVPCPTFASGAVTIDVGYKDCVPGPTGVINVTKEVIPGDCRTQDSCKFTIDLDLQIPIPKPPCPSFASGAVTIEVGYEDCVQGPTGAITITKEVIPGDCDTADSCKFTLDLDLQIPIPPPPCPEITATGAISINPALDEPKMEFGVVASTVQNGCEKTCKFDFDIDIEIPDFTCPEIKATGVIEKQSGLADPTMVFTVEKDPDKCAFDFSLDILIPDICPEITATGVVIITPGRNEPSMAFLVTKDPDLCKFDFDLTLEFPTVRPCPEYTGAVTVYEADEPTGLITFTLVPPAAPDEPCFYDIDLEIGVPVCIPEFTVEHNIFCTPGRDEITCTKFEISGPGPSGCDYVAKLDIEMPCPRPCPDITGVVTVYESSQPTGTLIVNHETPESESEQCVYELDLQIGVRSNTLEKGTVTAAWTVCDGTPTCDVTIDPPDENGIQKIHIDVRIPQPPIYTGGTIDLGDFGSGTITIDDEDPCSPVINATIELTTTECPTGGSGE